MGNIKFDSLIDLLKSNKNIVDVENQQEGNGNFNRNIRFKVKGNQYMIEWWKNTCYLHIDTRAFIVFSDVEISGTWPNRAKLNLQFIDLAGEKICILPIEDY